MNWQLSVQARGIFHKNLTKVGAINMEKSADTISININRHLATRILCIAGLATTLIISFLCYTSSSTADYPFIEIWLHGRIPPYILGFLTIVLTSVFLNIVINKKHSEKMSFYIAFIFTILFTILQFLNIFMTIDATDSLSVASIPNVIVRVSVTFAFGMITSIISLLITKVRKRQKQLNDHSIHSSSV